MTRTLEQIRSDIAAVKRDREETLSRVANARMVRFPFPQGFALVHRGTDGEWRVTHFMVASHPVSIHNESGPDTTFETGSIVPTGHTCHNDFRDAFTTCYTATATPFEVIA